MSFWRAAVTAIPRSRGAQVGPSSYIAIQALLREHRRIVVGSHTSIGRHVELHPQGGFIRIGNDCSVHNFVTMFGAGGITIGDDCRIATGVLIVAFNHRFDDAARPIRTQSITTRGVIVESDVWIGARVILLDGVTVGQGSVIGAGSVVTRDVPRYSVVVGNPARVVSHRG